MKISIVGGGRWARTIASVLCSLPSRPDEVIIHSRKNTANIASWIEKAWFGGRLRVTKEDVDFDTARDRPHAVIVANKTSEHFAAGAAALIAGVPVLVEKPISLPQSNVLRLCEIAETTGTLLAASNVFLFARYFEAYAEAVATLGKPLRLRFLWMDGALETRRGEVKSYDSTLTLFDDVLPHIVPMIGRLQHGDPSLVSFEVRRGGAELTLETNSTGCGAILTLGRDGSGRQRIIEVEAEGGTAVLDFSSEPGFIRAAGISCNGDPNWEARPRPLETMLSAFLAAVGGESLDPRLSPAHALSAAGLADTVRRPYLAHQIQWLKMRLGEPIDEPLRYAFKELAGIDADGAAAISSIWPSLGSAASLMTFLSKSLLLADYTTQNSD